MKKFIKSFSFKCIMTILLCFGLTGFLNSLVEKPLEIKENPVNSSPGNIKAEENHEMRYIPLEEEQTKTLEIEEIENPEQAQEEYVFMFTNPIEGEMIQEFSNGNPVYSKTFDDYRVHNGIDISANKLDRVYACEKGIIEKAYEDDLMGKTIIIDHLNGFKSVYSNLSTIEMVVNGQQVEKGKVISGVGDSAIAESSLSTHLHFEIIKDGKQTNPAQYLKQGT